jgi:hypothetical protein
MENWFFNISENLLKPEYVNMGFLVNDNNQIANISDHILNNLITSSNSTGSHSLTKILTEIHGTRSLWKHYVGRDKHFQIGFADLFGKKINILFGILAPMMICLLTSFNYLFTRYSI